MTDKPVVSNFSYRPTEDSRPSPPRLAMHIARISCTDSIVRWISKSLTQLHILLFYIDGVVCRGGCRRGWSGSGMGVGMLRGLSVQSFLVSVRVGFLVCWVLGFLVSEFLGFLVSKSLADPQTNTIKRQHQAKTCKFKLPSERVYPPLVYPPLVIYCFQLLVFACYANLRRSSFSAPQLEYPQTNHTI